MPKTLPAPLSIWSPPLPASGKKWKFESITPMFGGGVETRRPDPTFLIRPTAIRGQLQFWWRASVGAAFDAQEDLRRAQTKVWGSTERPSAVQVRIHEVRHSAPSPCAAYDRDRKDSTKLAPAPRWNAPFDKGKLPYALFPFQGQLSDDRRAIKVDPATYILRTSFTLELSCPDEFWSEITTALWAWTNFGGLGSRTRRGCGAIRCSEFAAASRQDLLSSCRDVLSQRTDCHEWPTIAHSILVGNQTDAPLAAWNTVVSHLQNFRQGVGFGRNPGSDPKRPGRSRWPEPESIREITGQRFSKHARQVAIPADAFPRAELGLPIVFHFKDKDKDDPYDTVLYPDDGPGNMKRERMASPLILKPVALADGTALPLVLRLNVPPLHGIDLRKDEQSLRGPDQSRIADPKLATYPNSPLAGSTTGSAADAFVAYLKNQGFSEVSR